MDSNGTRFLLLDSAADFRTAAHAGCGWDTQARAFTLTRQDTPRLPQRAPADALAAWQAESPWVLDDHGQLARLSADRRAIEVALGWPATNWRPLRASRDPQSPPAGDLGDLTLAPVVAPGGCTYTDLHLGGSGVLAAPYSDGGDHNGLLLVHLRHRWQAHCELPAITDERPFHPQRAWVDGADRVWLVGPTHLALCRGAPLLQPYLPRPDRFEPLAVNPDPLRCLWYQALPPHGGVIGLAADPPAAPSGAGGDLHLLVVEASGDAAAPRQALASRTLRDEADAPFIISRLPADLPLATDLASLGDRRVLLLPPLPADAASGLAASRHAPRDCPVVALADGADNATLADAGAAAAGTAQLLPERWPRRGESAVRFVRHRDGKVRHLAPDGVHRLYRLAQARFTPRAEATLATRLDAGDPGTVWDCLYLDASIPPGCRIQVSARAVDDWAERGEAFEPQPDPIWSPLASELPFVPSLARRGSPSGDPKQPGRSGLFEVLLQRSNGAVRELRGRYLSLRFTLSGDGRHTPAIHAARAWFPRFSWQAQYLPEHFHQQQAVDDVPSGQTVAANGADLRERIFASFEAVLTPIEDRIAASEALLYPESVPTPLLPHLAGLLGHTLRAHWPEPRQRRWLSRLGDLQARKGSYAGLCQALDIVTDGAVGRGQVVPVELFRLRRTLATVLGVSMDDAAHPLTLGTGQSGNSLVGETLILSDEHALAVLALFAPDLARPGVEATAVRQFFDDHARRLTVLLHGDARGLRGLVEDALPELVPATVQWNVVSSEQPFVPGLSPLLQIDTFLDTTPAPGPVRLDHTRLGRNDLIRNPVALSPEDARAVAPSDAPATGSPTHPATRGDWA
ncbi:MAG: hypothetical protein RL375_3428 [Pseudomonadota bacterium]